MRTGNPVLNEGAFDRWAQEGGLSSSSVMTVSGAVNKSMVLIGLTASLGLLSFSYLQNNPQLLMPSLIGSAIGGLIASLCVCFWLRSAPVAAPIYALLEGVFLGGSPQFSRPASRELACRRLQPPWELLQRCCWPTRWA